MANPAKNTICLWYDRDAEERDLRKDVFRFIHGRGA